MVERFLINLPADEASCACDAALRSFGWKLRSVEPSEFVISRGLSLRTNTFSTKVAVRLTPSDDGSQTTVTLNGTISGSVLTQDRQLREYFERIRGAMQDAEREASNGLGRPNATEQTVGGAAAENPLGGSRDPVVQLRTLGDLRQGGLVSEEEFDTKKAELLRRI